MEFLANAKDLKKKIAAFQTLFGRDPKVLARGPFDDTTGETVWGKVTATEVGKTRFSFRADGVDLEARIEAVETFYLS